MKRHPIAGATAFLSCCFMFAAAATERPSSIIAGKLETLYAVADSFPVSGNDRDDAIIDAYEGLFAEARTPATLNDVTDADLDLLFEAASAAEFYSAEPRHAREMILLLEELEARGLADSQHRADMYGALVHARMFDQARAFERAHRSQGLEMLPEFRQATTAREGEPVAWTVSPDIRLLIEQPVDLQVPATIVVVSHPGCHFSRAAVAAISDDALLGPVFAEHALWLAPPDRSLDFDLIQQWNRDHPSVRMSLAIDRDDWPMFDYWGTPTFYFFKDGELTAKVSGWPLDGGGRRTGVIDALHDIGLLE